MDSEVTSIGQQQDVQPVEIAAVAVPEAESELVDEGAADVAPKDEAEAAGPVSEDTATATSENETEAMPVSEAKEEPEKQSGTPPSPLEALRPGMRVKGTVRNVVDFGAFIDIGVGRDGLAHISTLKRAGIDKAIKVGDALDVQIRRVDVDENRISLTVPSAAKGDKTPLRDLKTDSIITGHVVRLVDFGAFVDIGAQTDGLLHISQLHGGYIGHPREVLKVGDEVKVRILDVDPQKRRVSLSMKNVGEVSENVEMLDESEPGDNAPTAFQLAWEEAIANRRHHKHKGRQ